MLAFTSVYFSELGLFNGLRPIQIKNFASLFTSRRGCVRTRLTRMHHARHRPAPARLDRAARPNDIAHPSAFAKQYSRISACQDVVRCSETRVCTQLRSQPRWSRCSRARRSCSLGRPIPCAGGFSAVQARSSSSAMAPTSWWRIARSPLRGRSRRRALPHHRHGGRIEFGKSEGSG
jgi:hypothetical protein